LPDEPLISYLNAIWAGNLPGAAPTDRIPELKRVIDRFPDYAPAYNMLAYAQWQAGQKGAAMATAATYMEKAPNQPNSHDTFAELAQWDGRYEDAVKHYTAAIHLDSTFVTGFYGLAEVYVLQGKGDLARQTLTASLPHTAVPVQRVGLHTRIANTHVLEGNVKAALTAYGAALAEAQKANLTGSIAGVHAAMMNLEAGLGDPKAAVAHLEHIRAVPPPPTMTPQGMAARLGGLGIAFAMIGQTAQARVRLDSLIQLGKTNPSPVATNQTHHLQGWVLLSEGKPAEALAEFAQGNPANAAVRVGSALAQQKLGKTVEARSIRDELNNDRNLNLANTQNIVARRMLKQKIT
jgi:tetratricopeptide (TPR) repeat protein